MSRVSLIRPLVVPGETVDSLMMSVPLCIFEAIELVALTKNELSGLRSLSSGVGTQIITISDVAIESKLLLTL